MNGPQGRKESEPQHPRTNPFDPTRLSCMILHLPSINFVSTHPSQPRATVSTMSVGALDIDLHVKYIQNLDKVSLHPLWLVE
jgi:hypothetical protein